MEIFQIGNVFYFFVYLSGSNEFQFNSMLFCFLKKCCQFFFYFCSLLPHYRRMNDGCLSAQHSCCKTIFFLLLSHVPVQALTTSSKYLCIHRVSHECRTRLRCWAVHMDFVVRLVCTRSLCHSINCTLGRWFWRELVGCCCVCVCVRVSPCSPENKWKGIDDDNAWRNKPIADLRVCHLNLTTIIVTYAWFQRYLWE